MEYEHLYTEYESAIETQKNVIKKYLKKVKAAQRSANLNEVKRLNGILSVLYTEKSELEQLASALKAYIS
ncbi:MAG: hypothetical protein ACI4XE_06895 [Acutalibacteraceae bacterium]